MRLHNLVPPPGSRKRRKIVGRGEGSGHGGSATRGTKGQRARSGERRQVGFEGGQMPLFRRVPKRGFTNAPFRKRFAILNIDFLERHFQTGQTVTPADLRRRGAVKGRLPIKILGVGAITKSLEVVASAFSRNAEKKIVAAGGTAKREL